MTTPPRWPSNTRLMLIALLSGMALVLAPAAWNRFFHPPAPNPKTIAASSDDTLPVQAAAPIPRANKLAPGIDLAAQLPLSAIARLHDRGYRQVIDLRPDGEAPDEPPSTAMAESAKAAGVRFDYVPVPHGDIPEPAVAALRGALANPDGPVLIYCRSGRRAARTWALVEAQRPGGMTTDAILAAVRQSGQEADDLRGRIEAGVAKRHAKARAS